MEVTRVTRSRAREQATATAERRRDDGAEGTVGAERSTSAAQPHAGAWTMSLPSIGSRSFRFTAYNVLAPWTEGDMRPGLAEFFDAATVEAALDYDHPSGLRRSNVADAVDGADVVVLVEVERRVVDNVLRRAEEPLEYKVGWRNDPYTQWGSCVLWRANMFEHVAETVGSLAAGQYTTQTCTVVVLRHRHTNSFVCVVAVHLKAGGGALESTRVEQARKAVMCGEQLLHAALRDPVAAACAPMIVAGDFNSDIRHPQAKVQRQMKRLGFDDAGGAQRPRARTYKHCDDAVFDHVYTRALHSCAFAVRDDVTQPIAPNLTEGSDHLPVSCTIEFPHETAADVECGTGPQ